MLPGRSLSSLEVPSGKHGGRKCGSAVDRYEAPETFKEAQRGKEEKKQLEGIA